MNKKKREDVQSKKLTAAPCEAIEKLFLKKMCHQKVYTYILLVMIMMK